MKRHGIYTPKKTPHKRSRDMSYKAPQGKVLTFKRQSKTRRANNRTRAAGFLAKGKKRSVRKLNLPKINKSVNITKEIGFQTSDSNCVFVGHATMPIKLYYQYAWMTIFKALALRAGRRVPDLEENVFSNGDQVIINWKPNEGAPEQTSSLVIGAGTNSVLEISAFYASTQRVWNLANANSNQVQLIELQYNPRDRFDDPNPPPVTDPPTAPTPIYSPQRRAVIDLQSFYLDFTSKSTLKIQNRTKLSASDDVESVDTQPLIGKFYEGSSNGTRVIQPSLFGTTPGTLLADENGAFRGAVPFDEPPLPSTLKDITKYGKSMMNPGQLKTSVLYTRRTILLDKLVHLFAESSPTKARTALGKFRVFAFEKMLQATDSESNITVAAEVNQEVNVSYHQRLNNATIRLFVAERQI